jgi:16S rRNA (cytosine1402-N4)-methyltransferase
LLQASVDGLNIKPDGIYVDVTFGGGGHKRNSTRLRPTESYLLSIRRRFADTLPDEDTYQ